MSQRETQERNTGAALSGGVHGTSEATAALVVGSTSGGDQTFSLERGEHELKVQTQAHKREMERERLQLEREETRKDNDQRRSQLTTLFVVVIAIIVVGLVAGLLIGTLAFDEDTRRFGQGLVTLLLGGVAGALAGYVSGRSGR